MRLKFLITRSSKIKRGTTDKGDRIPKKKIEIAIGKRQILRKE